ncbi:3312_t:CDS:2 [Diversispora eburnea]|uniref:3312_t:CDS:1 n=1 Tax=Diversispora eburnea TaxID=1213867 RepID=A0A9N8VTJ4_9GLOM|nr:3312_t:CDS:2 [Diversispora eburnea]
MSKIKDAKDKLHSLSVNFVNDRGESIESLSTTLSGSLSLAGRISEVVSIPLVGLVCSTISDIINICETTKQNKKICSSIIDRTIVTRLCVEKLQRIKATEINPSELIKPNVGRKTDRRGGNGITKRFIIKKEDKEYTKKRFQAELAILGKLKDSTNILRFYGLSKLEGHRVMVFEWTEWGNLQEVYSNSKVDWNNKIHIALDICRDLVFLHMANILHHDVRCRNIMMTPRLEPKIANFKYSRENDQMTTGYEKTVKVLHWMAPEKIKSTNEKPVKYTYECEIFSFGMLLWEMTFQKIPYKDLNIEEVKKTVLSGKRETFRFEKGSLELEKLQKKLKKIIENAWHDEPISRNSTKFFFTYNAKDYKTAWEIFECHANLAKYWKSYYYDHGYHVNRYLVTVANLYKELADDGLADASFRY